MSNTTTIKPLVASDVLKSDHPLNPTFTRWLGDKEATKRQARAFLAAFPQYRADTRLNGRGV